MPTVKYKFANFVLCILFNIKAHPNKQPMLPWQSRSIWLSPQSHHKTTRVMESSRSDFQLLFVLPNTNAKELVFNDILRTELVVVNQYKFCDFAIN